MQAASIKAPDYLPLYELSINNADKGQICVDSLMERVKQFHDSELVITVSPLFVQKALLFQNSNFVIGYDTYIRLVDAKYYTDKQEAMNLFKRNGI